MELEHHKTISTKKEKQNETDKNRGIREELRKEVREEISGIQQISDEELYEIIDRHIFKDRKSVV